jgi:hypothetical protein
MISQRPSPNADHHPFDLIFCLRRFKSIRKNASSHNREHISFHLRSHRSKRISKLTKIKRSNTQTLSEWAELFKDKPYYNELRDFIEEYESMRYGPLPGIQHDMTEFKKKCQTSSAS